MIPQPAFLLTPICLAIAFLACASSHADEIVRVDSVTDFFGNQNGSGDAGDASGLLFDEARTGGSDTNAQGSFAPVRRMAAASGTFDNWSTGLTTGTAGDVTFTGLGLTLRGGTTTTNATVTITYLGADDVFGSADDVVVGSVTDDLTYTTVGEYAWNFAAPLTFAWDGANDRFRFDLVANGGNIRMKSESAANSPSGQNGLKMSVGGNFVAAVPEPTSTLFLCSGMMLVASRRRR